MSVCLFVCVFSIEIQTDGQIWTKFGTELVLEGGKGSGGSTPDPPTCKYHRHATTYFVGRHA